MNLAHVAPTLTFLVGSWHCRPLALKCQALTTRRRLRGLLLINEQAQSMTMYRPKDRDMSMGWLTQGTFFGMIITRQIVIIRFLLAFGVWNQGFIARSLCEQVCRGKNLFFSTDVKKGIEAVTAAVFADVGFPRWFLGLLLY